jgi:hypothetical protein
MLAYVYVSNLLLIELIEILTITTYLTIHVMVESEIKEGNNKIINTTKSFWSINTET